MITLSFMTSQRKIITVIIDGRVVKWYDDMWKNGIQIYPLSHSTIKALLDSRSPRMKAYGLNIVEANKGKNLEEYESCKNEEEIANIIRRDCKSKALIELKGDE